MITRSRSVQHICLRCRRSLEKRYLSSKAQNVSEAALSSPAQNPQGNTPSIEQEFTSPEKRQAFTIRKLYTGGNGPQVAQRPLEKLHGHQGRKFREQQEDLGSNALGKPAKVIVLRESNLNFYQWTDKIEDQEVQHVDILSRLQDERGLAGRHEVEQNIFAHKPQKGQEPRSWDDLNELVRVLQEGFTSTQLVRYLESFQRPVIEYNGDNLGPKTRRTTKLSATSWKPGVSELKDQFDGHPLRGYMFQSHTAKQRQIIMILRTCWGLGLPEVEDGIGQFEVNLRLKDLELLSKGSPSRLSLLLKDYLASENETLEVFHARSVLRVTTLQHKRDIILQLLETEVNSIKRESLYLGSLFPSMASPSNVSSKQRRSLERWMERNFSESTLQELGLLTRTDIVKSSKDSVLISSTNNDPKSKLSTRTDLVRRLLLTVCDTAERVQYSLECNTVKDAVGTFVPYSRVEGLDWRARMRDWVRWTTPTAKALQSDELPVKTTTHRNHAVINYPVNGDEVQIESIRDEERSVDETNLNSYSGRHQVIESSAQFGSVLHSTHSATELPASLSFPFSTFSSFAPNVSRILNRATLQPIDNLSEIPGRPTTYLTLRFLPNPFQANPAQQPTPAIKSSIKQGSGNQLLKVLPPIEMRFSVSADTGSVDLEEVVAIMNESITDSMIPSNGIDIRWQTKTMAQLRRDSDAITEFVKNSIFDIRRQDLQTPPSLKISIDAALCKGEDPHVLGIKDTEPSEVEYLFAGLDIRKTLSFDFNGWRLLYTNVEAGRAGGHRGELKLRPIFNGKISNGKYFTQAAYQIARELGGSEKDVMEGYVGSVRNVDIAHQKVVVSKQSKPVGVAGDKETRYWTERVKIPLANEDMKKETLLGDGLWESNCRVIEDHTEGLPKGGEEDEGLPEPADGKLQPVHTERDEANKGLP